MTRPVWQDEASKRFAEFLKLKKGWNSYGGLPTTPQAVDRAMSVLGQILNYDSPLPGLLPTASGGIGIQLAGSVASLEIDVSAEGAMVMLYEQTTATDDELRALAAKVLA